MESNAILKEAREISKSSSPRNGAADAAPRRKMPSGKLPSIEQRPGWNPSVGGVPRFFTPKEPTHALEPYRTPLDCVSRDLDPNLPPFITRARPAEKYKPLGHDYLPNKDAAPHAEQPAPKRTKSAPRERPEPKPPAESKAPKTARNAPPAADSSESAAKKSSKPKRADDDTNANEAKAKPAKKAEVAPASDTNSKKESKPAAKPQKQQQRTYERDNGSIEMATDEDVKKLFSDLDKNGNRLLSLAELDLGVKTFYPRLDNKPAVIRAYKAADKDGSGLIGFNEFKFFLQFLVYHNNLWSAFAAADDDNDRRLARSEFLDICPALEVDNGDEVFDEMDANGGGYVLFEEFIAWIATNRPGLELEMSRAIVEAEEDEDKKKTKKQNAKGNGIKKDKSAEQPPPTAAMKIEIPSKAERMKIFDQLDPNGNGMLSLAELDKGVLELWPQFNNKPAIMRAYRAADRSGEGFVTRGEFSFFLRFLTYYNNLWHDFCSADDDGDRRITKEEFVDAAASLDIDDPVAAFAEMDENHGGFVLFDEFCAWMAKNQGADSRSNTPAEPKSPTPEPEEEEAVEEEAAVADEKPEKKKKATLEPAKKPAADDEPSFLNDE